MTSIGIIGAGISGLHLALRLQQLGVRATIYSPHDTDELGAGPPRNFPARFGHTQERERELGVFDWGFADAQVRSWAVSVGTDEEEPLEFVADLAPPSSVVDFRIYLPRLLSRFVERGGDLRVGEHAVEDLVGHHDLLVVASGDRSTREIFPVTPRHSPFTTPQRILCSGIYTGIREELPHSLDIYFLPGVGEILRLPFYSLSGRADVLAFEAVPGGPLETVSHIGPAADPRAFRRSVLSLVATFAPDLRERIDDHEFGLTAPGEIAQGGITPAVRGGWSRVGDDTFAMAIGDAWIVNDPLTAQGANLGSRTAFVLADAIVTADGPFDETFCRLTSARLWDHARHVVAWSNAFLAEPPPHVHRLFRSAAAEKAIADAFVNKFNDPVDMWRTLSSEEELDAFLSNCRASAERPTGGERRQRVES